MVSLRCKRDKTDESEKLIRAFDVMMSYKFQKYLAIYESDVIVLNVIL